MTNVLVVSDEKEMREWAERVKSMGIEKAPQASSDAPGSDEDELELTDGFGLCYECDDGLHEQCIGVPCQCTCDFGTGKSDGICPRCGREAIMNRDSYYECCGYEWRPKQNNGRLRNNRGPLQVVRGGAEDPEGDRTMNDEEIDARLAKSDPFGRAEQKKRRNLGTDPRGYGPLSEVSKEQERDR